MVNFEGLEGTLATEFTENAGNGIGVLPQLAQVGQLGERAGDPQVKPVLDNTLGQLKKTLSLFYKSLQASADENTINQQVGQAIGILTGEDTPTKSALFSALAAFGNSLYATMPADKQAVLGKKAFETEFKAAYGVGLADAWKEGTLIDKFEYKSLSDEYKSAIFNSLKEGPRGSVRGLAGKVQALAKAVEEEQHPEVKKNKATVMEQAAEEIVKVVEAYITGVYGFSKEVSGIIAGALLHDTDRALAVFGPLFANAAKKAALTMGEDKSKDIAQYRGAERIRALYGAPPAEEGQAS